MGEIFHLLQKRGFWAATSNDNKTTEVKTKTTNKKEDQCQEYKTKILDAQHISKRRQLQISSFIYLFYLFISHAIHSVKNKACRRTC